MFNVIKGNKKRQNPSLWCYYSRVFILFSLPLKIIGQRLLSRYGSWSPINLFCIANDLAPSKLISKWNKRAASDPQILFHKCSRIFLSLRRLSLARGHKFYHTHGSHESQIISKRSLTGPSRCDIVYLLLSFVFIYWWLGSWHCD